jgi:uncharacterized protein YeaO (DUF488 family)
MHDFEKGRLLAARTVYLMKGGVMSIRIVRLGYPREAGEGLRIGTVRRPPRGVPKSEFAKRDFYDVWFPNLSPSQELLKEGRSSDDDKSWSVFKKKFRAQMSEPEASKVLDLLAALSHQTNMSLGCYCEDENRCHRSVLRELLIERGADLI